MNHIKKLRGQIRQIVKEILPEVLKEEFVKELNVQINNRMEVLAKETKEILTSIDERSKAVQHYTLRQNANLQVKSKEQKDE